MTQPPQQPYDQQPYGQQPHGQQPTPGQPYPNQYGQQPPAQPPKKRKKWPWILLAVVVVLIIVIATSGGEDEGSSASGGGTSQSDNGGSDAAPVAGIGSEVRDGKFAFVVTGVEPGVPSIGENQYLTKEAQGQFVLVHVDVSNISDKPQSYFGANQKLTDVQGREFTNDTEAEIYLNSDTMGDINPGNKMSTTIVFDVPVDAQPKALELHDSMMSGGVTVALN